MDRVGESERERESDSGKSEPALLAIISPARQLELFTSERLGTEQGNPRAKRNEMKEGGE